MSRTGRPYELTLDGILGDADGFRGPELEMRAWARRIARSHIDRLVVVWDEHLDKPAYRVIARANGTFWANGRASR